MHAVRTTMLNKPASKKEKDRALRLEQGLDPDDDDDPRNIINKENRNQLQLGSIPLHSSFSNTAPSTPNCKENPDSGRNLFHDKNMEDDDEDGEIVIPGLHTVEALKKEIERLREDKLQSIEEIDNHKKKVTLGIVLAIFCFCFAISMIAWKFSEHKPSYSELRQKLLTTPYERPRICQTLYPKLYSKTFDPSSVGESLFLTDYLDESKREEGANKARVDNVLQSEISYSGFLRVNDTHNSSLFFWFFPARSKAADSPLLLWLEGGPGWPTTYALFKENGPFLVGWDETSYLLPNKHSWTSNHNMLYIDNPVGTGFSFTENKEGYPKTDEKVAEDLIEALRQFMLFLPYMVPGSVPAAMPLFAFGQSYGGAYVVSLSHLYLSYRENNKKRIENIWLKGIGIGNGFISPTDQSLYADYVSNLGYLTDSQYQEMKKFDDELLKSLDNKNYVRALEYSHKSLNYFVTKIMKFTNIYDFTFNQNYLTNHEYVCFLQQDAIRQSIHTGPKSFNRGIESYHNLNNTIMVSKKDWLEETLEREGIEVLIYNGNLDVIVNVAGTNRLVNSLRWSGQGEFAKSERKSFWVWNPETGRGELAGYANEGGGLTYVVVRNAGHMVPISQPRWAHELVTQFTHYKKGEKDRFEQPDEMKSLNSSETYTFVDC